ncbi:MAG: rhodanese-like domain-containing protein [Limisphaerales bacterium]
MKGKTIQSGTYRGRETIIIVLEALAVLLVGIAFALAANQLSPRGLVLGRNYFPAKANPPAAATIGAGSPGRAPNTPAPSPADLLASRLKEQGLQLIDGRRALAFFHDPRFQQGRVVFVDARDEAHYRKGHIPGAYEFDPYYPEKYFSTVLPPCQAAEQIVIYCNGGDCDDSEFAAITLRDVGIAVNKLLVYDGGIMEWATNGLPVETGARNGGALRSADK